MCVRDVLVLVVVVWSHSAGVRGGKEEKGIHQEREWLGKPFQLLVGGL